MFKFIRWYLDDLLVIPLLYCLVRMVSKLSVKWAILLVMGVAFTAEIAQLLQMHKLLNIKQELTLVLMGTSFSFIDLIAYTSGIIPIYFIEKLRNYETD